MPDPHGNFIYSNVQAGSGVIGSTSGTTLDVGSNANRGARFPDPAVVGAYNIDIWPVSVQQVPENTEIVRATAKSGSVLTVARAQESTSARADIALGDQCAIPFSAKSFTDIENPAPGQIWRPNWHGQIMAAFGNGDPQDMLIRAMLGGNVAPTPTNWSTSVARIAYFIPPYDITVNKIRFFGVGATTNVYRVAIYNADTLARLTSEIAFTTAAATWGAAGSALGLTLTAGQLYFIACSVNATGTTAGLLAFTSTNAATTGQVAVLPKSYPGNLDVDLKFTPGTFAQFAVTTGALPAPAATIAAQGVWTGGFPAFWLDNNNA